MNEQASLLLLRWGEGTTQEAERQTQRGEEERASDEEESEEEEEEEEERVPMASEQIHTDC